MDNDKKQVIPRNQYRRKRREFFHNEEREQRLKKIEEEKKHLAEREEQQAKVNEERVKDNLRKARIEKLTQEEIQMQHRQAETIQSEQNKKTAKNNEEVYNFETQSLGHTTNDGNNDNSNEIESNKAELQNENSTNSSAENDLSRNNSLRNINKDEENKDVEEQNGQVDKEKKIETFYDNQEEHSELNEKPHSKINNESKDNVSNKQSVQSENETTQSSSSKNDAHKESVRENDEHTFNRAQVLDSIVRFFKNHWIKVVIVVAVILLILLLSAIFKNVNQTGSNQNGILSSMDTNKKYTSTMKSANSAVKSVVTVENETPKASSIPKENNSESEVGSGVVYKKVGDTIYVMTNAHVVEDEKIQKLTFGNNNVIKGNVIGKDKWSDIAVIKAKLNSNDSLKPIDMGDSSNLILGETILVVGNPLGVDFKGSVSKGIISGLDRYVPADFDKDGSYDVLAKSFQVDAPVNPGNSGGAVVDEQGELVGIASLKIDMNNVEGMAFAIPINDAKHIAQEIEDKGKVKYPNTGIQLKNVADLNNSERDSIGLPENVKMEL